MCKINLYILLSLLTSFASYAEDINMLPIIRLNSGIILNSIAEKEDSLVSTDGTSSSSTPFKGSSSNIIFEANYEKFLDFKKSYYLHGGGTLLGGDSKYFDLGGGMNFYFTPLGTKLNLNENGFQINITPKLRYYAGGGISGAYLVYNTVSDSKGDFLVELEAHGGVIYPFDQKWSLSGEIGLGRAVGTLISNTQVKFTVGISTNLGEIKL